MPSTGRPTEPERPWAIQWQARDDVSLGHAVAVNHRASERLFQTRGARRGELGPTAGEQANAMPAPARRLELGPVEETVVEGGYAHEHRGLSRGGPEYVVGETIGNDHAAARHEAQVRRERKPMNVKQWQRIDQYIIGGKPPAPL